MSASLAVGGISSSGNKRSAVGSVLSTGTIPCEVAVTVLHSSLTAVGNRLIVYANVPAHRGWRKQNTGRLIMQCPSLMNTGTPDGHEFVPRIHEVECACGRKRDIRGE